MAHTNTNAHMQLDTVIFDMDGLLIDSEPLWQEAAEEVLERWQIKLTQEQFHQSTGLGTRTFLEKWMKPLQPSTQLLTTTENEIVAKVVDKVKTKAEPLPGVNELFSLFKARKFKIGLATSSPFALIRVVTEMLGISHDLSAISSGTGLPYSKPHPQVYLNCAMELNSEPTSCICFEDSFNGMIAAKAARMVCVVVPAQPFRTETRWDAADLRLNSLLEFTGATLDGLLAKH